MTQINSYLTFNGNCREAMTFYAACLGGELTFQTIGESPLADKLPEKMKDCILHAVLTRGALVMMASDMVGEKGLIKGTAVSLMLNCSSEAEIRNFYTKLSEDGEPTHPLEDSFWGALFGDLTDKFGNNWLLHFDKINGKKMKSNKSFPVKLAAPALRALANAKITTLEQLAGYSEKEIAGLHGIGNNALLKLKEALHENGLALKK